MSVLSHESALNANKQLWVPNQDLTGTVSFGGTAILSITPTQAGLWAICANETDYDQNQNFLTGTFYVDYRGSFTQVSTAGYNMSFFAATGVGAIKITNLGGTPHAYDWTARLLCPV